MGKWVMCALVTAVGIGGCCRLTPWERYCASAGDGGVDSGGSGGADGPRDSGDGQGDTGGATGGTGADGVGGSGGGGGAGGSSGAGGMGGSAAAGGVGGAVGTGGAAACTWWADSVPLVDPPAGGISQGQSMDTAGYVYAVWFVFAGIPFNERHDLVVRMRPPGAAWTEPLVMFSGILAMPWNGQNPSNLVYASDGRAYVLHEDGSGFPIIRSSPQYPSSAIGDTTCHRPPVTWPQRGNGRQTSGGSYAGDSVFNAQDGFVSFGLAGLRAGTNPQRDGGGGTTCILFDDTASGAPMLARNPGTGWTFVPAPAGRLMVTPGGTPAVLDVGAGTGVTLQTWAEDAWTAAMIDRDGLRAGFASDVRNNIHIAYATSTGVRYARISGAGAITIEAVEPTPAPLLAAAAPPGYSTEAFDVRVDRNGTVRIFNGGTVFTRCAPDPDWATPTPPP